MPDFVVEYEIDLCEELKEIKLEQGMRIDFLYDGDDPQVEGVHMIWPELLDEKNEIVLEVTQSNIAKQGKANMWVVDEARRPYHAKRIKIGTKGIWWRGGRIAYVTVVNNEGLKC
ncbi:MAG: hypothetical protein OQJ95_11535 [Kangiella sp.]|nr:hypothetical protein [Kangiella sp.]